MAKSPLEVIFGFCNIDQEHIDFVKKTLYKYKDDPVVNLVCTIINENSAQIKRLNELFTEANPDRGQDWGVSRTWPLIIPSPNSPTELRVYPNIILDDHNSLEGISSTYCQSQLKTFLTEYEADIADKKKKQRWLPQERAEKRLLEFIDMPTARALQRYVFTDGKLKDHQVRDFAEAIDSCRKPLELIFTEKPEDYLTMYATGPHSCMAMGAAERQHWEFLKAEGLAPTSWYHYSDLFNGVYAVKGKTVIARTILFKGKEDKNWSWVRVYASNDAVRKKFISTLAEQGIQQCKKAVIPTGYNFTVPGIRKGSVFAAPWPYIDAPIPSPHSDGSQWHVKFNKNDNSFTFYFKNPKLDVVNSRSGHVISSDYSTMECTSCGKVIKRNEALNVRIEHEYHIFCSDTCAGNEGFVRVIEGTGNYVFKQPEPDFIDVEGNEMIKFSTEKAAGDQGYHPMMEQIGIFPEETYIKVLHTGYQIRNDEGKYFICRTSGHELNNHDLQRVSKVPLRMLPSKKLVEYNEDKLFAVA